MRNEQLKLANDLEDVVHLISKTVARHRRVEVAKAVAELAPILWGRKARTHPDTACFYWIQRRYDLRSDAVDRAIGRDGEC